MDKNTFFHYKLGYWYPTSELFLNANSQRDFRDFSEYILHNFIKILLKIKLRSDLKKAYT